MEERKWVIPFGLGKFWQSVGVAALGIADAALVYQFGGNEFYKNPLFSVGMAVAVVGVAKTWRVVDSFNKCSFYCYISGRKCFFKSDRNEQRQQCPVERS